MWDGIKDQYIIAYFDEECVREIEGKLPFKTAWAQSKSLVGNTWSQIKSKTFWILVCPTYAICIFTEYRALRDILVRNFLFVLIYLFFHFTVQLLYQFDWFCMPAQRNGNFTFAEFGIQYPTYGLTALFQSFWTPQFSLPFLSFSP